MKNTEAIKKFFRTPGKCSLEEVEQTEEFILNYKKYRNTYRQCVGSTPHGLTLESLLDSINWYKNYIKDKEANYKLNKDITKISTKTVNTG